MPFQSSNTRNKHVNMRCRSKDCWTWQNDQVSEKHKTFEQQCVFDVWKDFSLLCTLSMENGQGLLVSEGVLSLGSLEGRFWWRVGAAGAPFLLQPLELLTHTHKNEWETLKNTAICVRMRISDLEDAVVWHSGHVIPPGLGRYLSLLMSEANLEKNSLEYWSNAHQTLYRRYKRQNCMWLVSFTSLYNSLSSCSSSCCWRPRMLCCRERTFSAVSSLTCRRLFRASSSDETGVAPSFHSSTDTSCKTSPTCEAGTLAVISLVNADETDGSLPLTLKSRYRRMMLSVTRSSALKPDSCSNPADQHW